MAARVDVTTEDGTRFSFRPNPREDGYATTDGWGLTPVHKCCEDVKKEAQETREAIRKAGLLP